MASNPTQASGRVSSMYGDATDVDDISVVTNSRTSAPRSPQHRMGTTPRAATSTPRAPGASPPTEHAVPGGAEPGAVARTLKVLTGTWNVGNAQPDADLAALVPIGGGGYDLIVIGAQECKYKVKDRSKASGGDDSSAADDDGASDAESVAEADAAGAGAGSGAAGGGAGGGAGAGASASATARVSKEVEAAARQPGDSGTHFFSVIAAHAGENYYIVKSESLWEMRLVVLAKRSLKSHIRDVACGREATGALHVMGNKGGIATKLTVLNTQLCFISCHLAAHLPKLSRRNQDVQEVLEGIRLGNLDLDVDSQFHHCFFMGDLNYRCDWSIRTGKQHTVEEKIANVAKLVEANKFKELWAMDQLRQEREANRVLMGFQEGRYNFKPTFKMLREPGFKYKPQRSSSYCDRILWKSLPGRARDIKQTMLEACPSIASSDHKPVRAAFAIDVRQILAYNSYSSSCPQLVFSDISGTDLMIADVRTSDPYLKFYSEPRQLLSHGRPRYKPARSSTKKNTLNPAWTSDELPRLRLMIKDTQQLHGASIMIAVKDYDRLNQDDRMGHVTLGLAQFINKKLPVSFSLPVISKGVQHGTLHGRARIIMPQGDGYAGDSMHVRNNGGCCTVQ